MALLEFSRSLPGRGRQMGQGLSERELLLTKLDTLTKSEQARKIIETYSQGLLLDREDLEKRFLMSASPHMTYHEVMDVLIRQGASRIMEDPDYGVFATNILHRKIGDEVSGMGVHSFSDAVRMGQEEGILTDKLREFVEANETRLNIAIDESYNELFTYFGLATIYDRYLLRHPTKRFVFERPQYLFMRVACGVVNDIERAILFYKLMASFSYMPGSPTLFNAGTKNPQLSSCFLVDSPNDSLEDIYRRYTDVAKLSKHGGGIGISYSKVRSRGSLIRGTNGRSSGIGPWLKTLDSSVAAVNQGGRRKGACCATAPKQG